MMHMECQFLNSVFVLWIANTSILSQIRKLKGLKQFQFGGKPTKDADLEFEKFPFINKAQDDIKADAIWHEIWNAVITVCNKYLLCHSSEKIATDKASRLEWLQYLYFLWHDIMQW